MIERKRPRNGQKFKTLGQSLQNYRSLFLNIQICDVLEAVAVVGAKAPCYN